jgi:hypothetical protein
MYKIIHCIVNLELFFTYFELQLKGTKIKFYLSNYKSINLTIAWFLNLYFSKEIHQMLL